MSVNWVMLTPDGKDIVPLENETIFFREQDVRFELDNSNGGYPGAGVNYASKSGTIILTNQRIVYLCAAPTSFFTSASLPMSNVQDSKLVQSWFSAPVFKAVVMPVPGGGLKQPARLSITFSSGNLHEFDAQYRSLRERLQELDGAAPQHLEQLPVYAPPSEPVPGPSATTSSTPFPMATATTSAPAPQPQHFPHYPPPPLEARATSSAPHYPPPPPQAQQQPQPQPPAVPSDLPPSYDEIR
ncbi:hypothetical protein BX616_009104 [Lobosporangium transversale]|uniref:GRAM domain-containing protein n=1 Tax=Lobosporangium transversale TaxID=64571 RepID=A0A1Y2GJQ9_9FUNG|nr:hypothetical protein BCR41DRAFT_358653 [Lobosporangium transversale]KAF9914033.1 hypothetical protein BX616_009104 [Lobosporangium transversale]ORZ09395.1 hypothetical protein BCR41DRAFT_358653 [Lobosporangium transversale]|eukprot:XP_021878848.1 hypothetical protein BCR41DRAFT_358653 [Lobosporangium transversale]